MELWKDSQVDKMAKKKAEETCVRICLLVRLLPPLSVSDQFDNLFEILATHSDHGKVVRVVPEEGNPMPTLVVEKEGSNALAGSLDRGEETVYCLKLAEALVKLCFMPGFTMHDSQTAVSTLWTGTKVKSPTQRMSELRMVVMECMLTSLYLGETMAKRTRVNYFLQYYCTYELANYWWSRRIIYSLLNLGLNIRENGYLPYFSHLYIQDNQARSSVLALNLLALLITREHKIDHVSIAFGSDKLLDMTTLAVINLAAEGEREKLSINSFRTDYLTKFVSTIEDEMLMDTWLTSLYNNVRNPLDSSNTILPMSMKKTKLFEESLIILTRLCHLNETCRSVLSLKNKFGSLVYVAVSYLVKEHFSKNQNKTLYELLLTFLIEFTSKKEICVRLNNTINESVVIPEIPVVAGSSIDLLMVAISNLIMDAEQFTPYLFNFAAILRNISVYAKGISALSAHSLISAVKTYMVSQKLLGNPQSIVLLRDLIDAVNRLLVHQFEMNPHFLMELMVNSPIILKVGKLNFSEEILGQIFHPEVYKIQAPGQDKNEMEEPKSPLAVESIPEEIQQQMKNLSDFYKKTKSEINLLYIFRFKQGVETNVLKEKINPNMVYSDYALKQLSMMSKVGIIEESDKSLARFLGVDLRQTEFGRHFEFQIWSNLASKLICHPLLDIFQLFSQPRQPVSESQDTNKPAN